MTSTADKNILKNHYIQILLLPNAWINLRTSQALHIDGINGLN